MPKQLTDAQIAQYRRDGFVYPVRALNASEARSYRTRLEAHEMASGARITEHVPRTKYKMRTYLLYRWAYELAIHPVVLDAVEDLIGPNILLLHSTLFIKEPRTTQVAAWHQDSTYFGLTSDDDFVTSWVALSDATPESGFMKFVPGTDIGQVLHYRGYAGSMNSLAQAVQMEVDDKDAVQASLKPGEFSLHHSLILHFSGPNQSDDRRIGFACNYIPPHVRSQGTIQRTATLVRGVDEFNYYAREYNAMETTEEEAVTEHDRCCTLFRGCHDEQVRWHEEGLDRCGRPVARAL